MSIESKSKKKKLLKNSYIKILILQSCQERVNLRKNSYANA